MPLMASLIASNCTSDCTSDELPSDDLLHQVLGALIVYIFPALIYVRARPAGPALERAAVYSLVPIGAVVGVLGVLMTLKGA